MVVTAEAQGIRGTRCRTVLEAVGGQVVTQQVEGGTVVLADDDRGDLISFGPHEDLVRIPMQIGGLVEPADREPSGLPRPARRMPENAFRQIGRTDTGPVGQPDDRRQERDPQTALEQADLGVVETGGTRQVFLAHAEPSARVPQVLAELLGDTRHDRLRPGRPGGVISNSPGAAVPGGHL